MINKFACLLLMSVAMYSHAHAASFEDGQNAFDTKQYQQAAGIWQTLAEQGDIASQISLAGMYTIGLGVEKDLDKAFELYQQAAQLGSAKAQNQLGKIYATGQGIERDPKAGRKWYFKAAEQGYAEAIYNVGVGYFRGEGVVTDYVKAHAWMHVAVVLGYDSAKLYRDQLAEVLSKEKLASSSQISERLLEQLKKQGKLSLDENIE